MSSRAVSAAGEQAVPGQLTRSSHRRRWLVTFALLVALGVGVEPGHPARRGRRRTRARHQGGGRRGWRADRRPLSRGRRRGARRRGAPVARRPRPHVLRLPADRQRRVPALLRGTRRRDRDGHERRGQPARLLRPRRRSAATAPVPRRPVRRPPGQRHDRRGPGGHGRAAGGGIPVALPRGGRGGVVHTDGAVAHGRDQPERTRGERRGPGVGVGAAARPPERAAGVARPPADRALRGRLGAVRRVPAALAAVPRLHRRRPRPRGPVATAAGDRRRSPHVARAPASSRSPPCSPRGGSRPTPSARTPPSRPPRSEVGTRSRRRSGTSARSTTR